MQLASWLGRVWRKNWRCFPTFLKQLFYSNFRSQSTHVFFNLMSKICFIILSYNPVSEDHMWMYWVAGVESDYTHPFSHSFFLSPPLFLSFFLSFSIFLYFYLSLCVYEVLLLIILVLSIVSLFAFFDGLSLSLCLCFLLPFLCFLSLYLVTMNSYTLFTFVFPLPLNLSLCIHRETLCLYFFADLSECVCVWEKEKECDNQIK